MLTAVSLALACLGCTDASPTLAASPPRLPSILATVECAVDLRAGGIVTCTEPAPAVGAEGGPPLALLGQNQIKMRSANGVSDTAAQTFSMEATAQNLLSYAIGTPDGQVVTGLKVFFETGPTATAYYTPGDTGTVKVRNPDGHQNFTAAQQPYHFYDTILQPQEITRPKRWEFHVPRAVARFGFTVRVFTATPREIRVPEAAPDHLPDRYLISESYRFCDVSGMPECIPDALRIRFHSTASREERQSAIDAVGVLEGGSRDLGAYYIRIAGDTTLTRLRAALTLLRQLPQVAYAYPYGDFPGGAYSRFPNDGAGWERWQTDPALSDGRNWALEKISAPLAWGCDTGSVAVPVAVVDSDFHLVADLMPNVMAMDSLVGQLNQPADSDDHGTSTTSLIGAVGNNSQGITGLNWAARVRLYEVARRNGAGAIIRNPTTGKAVLGTAWMAAAVARAARDSASVINLSMGINWVVTARNFGWIGASDSVYDPSTETIPARKLRRDSVVVQLRDLMVGAITEAKVAANVNPLVIIAAGNDGVDAHWSGFAQAAALLPNNFLIVAAGKHRSGPGLDPTNFTNFGALVEIAAPGQEVFGLNSGGLGEFWGTSYAAPLVTGTAALLLSFDPRLAQRADTLKALILQGASRGRSGMLNGPGSTDTVPVLNAYGALRAAAQRNTAPLCGNRMWSDGGRLIAQRRTSPETLLTLPSTSHSIRQFDAMHGGRRVRLLTWERGQYVSDFRYQAPAGTWARSAAVPRDSALWPVEGSGGGFNSTHRTPGLNFGYVSMYSHGGDTVVQLRTVPNADGYGAGARLTLIHAGGTRELAPIPAPISVGASYSTECWIKRTDTNDCMDYLSFVHQSRQMEWTGTYSPLGDSLYIVGRVVLYGGWLEPWEACPVAPPGDTIKDEVPDDVVRHCRPHRSGSGIDSTFEYVVDIRTGTSRQLRARTRSMKILGMTEDGREFITREEDGNESTRTYFYVIRPTPDAAWYEMRSHFVRLPSTLQCSLVYRSAETGIETYVPIPLRPNCTTDVGGQGAANRLPDTR